MRRNISKKLFSILALFSVVFNNLATPLYVYSQEVTPEPATEQTQTVEPTATETPAVTETIVEPTVTPEETVTPTPEVTLTPEIVVDPAPATEAAQPAVEGTQTTDQQPNEGAQSQAPPTETVTVSPTPTVEVVNPQGDEKLQVNIIQDVNAVSIDYMDIQYNPDGTASITTDKLDYAPTDVVVITGTGFEANKQYDLVITGTGDFSFTDKVTVNETGELLYSYQLDGEPRPDYKAEVKSGDVVIASTTFTDHYSVKVCHATQDQTKPYEEETATSNEVLNVHKGHDETVWFPGISDSWGDIIAASGCNSQGKNCSYNGLNWNDQGKVIYNNDCNISEDLIVTKTNDLNGNSASVGQTFEWKLKIENVGQEDAKFEHDETILTDNLPDEHVEYGTPSKFYSNVDHGNDIRCEIDDENLTCKVHGDNDVTIEPGGYIEVTFDVTFSKIGTYDNPREEVRDHDGHHEDGICRVDPNDKIDEFNEDNNDCSDSVTVGEQVLPEPGILIEKTNVLNSDGTATYTLKVSNTGKQYFNKIEIHDVLPGGFTYVAGSSILDADSISDPTENVATKELVWTIDEVLAQDTSKTLVYKVNINSDLPAGKYTNFAYVTGIYCNRPQNILFSVNISDGINGCTQEKDSEVAQSVIELSSSIGYGGKLVGQVLGASIEALPATGSETWVIMLASALFVVGFAAKGAAFVAERKRRNA
jgi:uncharacterized repeat protein (TIGR01451 family)